MDKEELIARFESEMAKVKRPGIDKLMDYIRKSDFYTAPASTKFHLSCESGLLQHSLNVLDALRGLLQEEQTNEDGTKAWFYTVAGTSVAQVKDESVILIALLHDICKTYFYSTSTRNVKNEKTGKWEKVPFYTVNDLMPLGHGPKSAMLIKNYIKLTSEEMYAIWWHMGFTDPRRSDSEIPHRLGTPHRRHDGLEFHGGQGRQQKGLRVAGTRCREFQQQRRSVRRQPGSAQR